MKKPILLHYYITNRCNSRCTFCDIWKALPKLDAIPADVVTNLKSARNAGCTFVDFTGGEPLLHPDLPLFLKEAKNQRFITSVTTNCIDFPKRVSQLAGYVDLLHFSLDGGTATLHNTIRGTDSFDKVMESIPLALSYNMAPDLLFTYTDENIDSFESAYAIAKKNRLIIILDPVFNCDGPDILLLATHRKARQFSKWKGVYLNPSHLRLRKIGGNNIDNPICKAVTSTIVITPDNCRVLPCYHHAQDELLLNSGLAAVGHSPEEKNWQALQGRDSICEGCHINCYFDPSYLYAGIEWSIPSVLAKARYGWNKYVVYGRKIPKR